MDFIIAFFVFIVVAWIVLKLLGLIFHAGIFMLTLPFKLLGLVIALILTPLILIPMGLLAGLTAILILPLAIIGPALPFVLIGLGIWAILRKN
ncbi:hypothetical protein [Caldithrix abyssi]